MRGRSSTASSEETVRLRNGAIAEVYRAIQFAIAEDRTQFIESVLQASQYLNPGSSAATCAISEAPLGPEAVSKRQGWLAPSLTRKANAYIENHLADRILVEDLAQQLKLSSNHFSRNFRQTFGEPPHAHICHQRMARAQMLMLTTKSAVCRIARDCGLADQHHFNRMFGRVVGETPALGRGGCAPPRM